MATIRSTDPPRQLMKDGDLMCPFFLEFHAKTEFDELQDAEGASGNHVVR